MYNDSKRKRASECVCACERARARARARHETLPASLLADCPLPPVLCMSSASYVVSHSIRKSSIWRSPIQRTRIWHDSTRDLANLRPDRT